jgi:broad specificity phosphatase PhoE
MKRHAVAFALLFAALSAIAAPPPEATTVIVVRHAEKAGPTGDVPLNDAGRARAQELARVLAGAGVTAVYDTQYIRTQQTAEPLASAMKIKPARLETTDTYPRDLVRDIEKNHAGSTVVVVSHSNLIPDVLRALGVADPPKIADGQYDDLFIVTRGRLLSLRYGAAAR